MSHHRRHRRTVLGILILVVLPVFLYKANLLMPGAIMLGFASGMVYHLLIKQRAAG